MPCWDEHSREVGADSIDCSELGRRRHRIKKSDTVGEIMPDIARDYDEVILDRTGQDEIITEWFTNLLAHIMKRPQS